MVIFPLANFICAIVVYSIDINVYIKKMRCDFNLFIFCILESYFVFILLQIIILTVVLIKSTDIISHASLQEEIIINFYQYF